MRLLWYRAFFVILPHKITLTTTMRKLLFISIISIIACAIAACSKRKYTDKHTTTSITEKLPGDSMIYGLACDGCNDTVVVFLPEDGGDPIYYDITSAMRNNKVFGHPEIGDWIAIMVNPDNKKEATMIIDLDQLKGTWTYQVMPTLKENALKSEKEIHEELSDSLRALIFIPREYGFTLKRQNQASSVGAVYKGNSLSDESIVEYPPVKRYTAWHTFNGRVILTCDTVDKNRVRLPDSKVKRDTAELLYMLGDTLTMSINGKEIGFHRQKNAMEANKKAREAARKQAKSDSISK